MSDDNDDNDSTQRQQTDSSLYVRIDLGRDLKDWEHRQIESALGGLYLGLSDDLHTDVEQIVPVRSPAHDPMLSQADDSDEQLVTDGGVDNNSLFVAGKLRFDLHKLEELNDFLEINELTEIISRLKYNLNDLERSLIEDDFEVNRGDGPITDGGRWNYGEQAARRADEQEGDR
jgi:hypothetical protein